MNPPLRILLIYLAFYLSSCTPDCEPVAFFSVDGNGFQHQQEILIRANPTSVLEGKNIIFSSRSRSASVTVEATETRFVANVGLLLRVPPGINGDDVELLLDDPDCGPISLGKSLTIGDESFFLDNVNFIPPPSSLFIIPVSAPVLPPLVRNAWLHPEITDYCLWFRFVLDSDDMETETLCPATSRELSLNCDGSPDLYHDNAVYGIIDKDNNYINFWIDRTSKNAGIEEFEGQFINVDDTPFGGEVIPPCGPPWVGGRNHMMLVVSKKTGRQLILYQQLTEADANGNGLDLRPFELEQQCRFDPN